MSVPLAVRFSVSSGSARRRSVSTYAAILFFYIYSLIFLYLFFSLVLDPLAVRFSVSSGCARRRSVSTYAAILVLLFVGFF